MNKYNLGCFVEIRKRCYNHIAFQKSLNESDRRQSKIWVEKGSEFYKRSVKSWLQERDTAIY